jgi:APA family basic amino acid/polyamine antiporter
MAEAIPVQKVGLWTSTAIVVGNMIGSGIFMLPAALALYGGISLIGWIGSSLGAIALAKLFSDLSKRVGGSSGGPYVFTRAGLGNFAAFLVAWGYWISICSTNAAIAVAFVSYLTVFFPVLANNAYLAIGAGLVAVWSLTWINGRGIKAAGRVQVVTTILKLMPLILIAVVGIFYINPDHFVPFNRSEESSLGAITATITLTLFAFLGMESATIPSGNIRNPESTIPRATMIGTAITILVYILGSTAVIGLIPGEALTNSSAPFADAASQLWGEQAGQWVALGAIVSTFGALNGWILLQGQIPMAAASDKLFPSIFARTNRKGMPIHGLVISSLIISGLMVMNFTRALNDLFRFMILLGTVTVLVPYLFSAASHIILLIMDRSLDRKKRLALGMITGAAFLYSIWAVVGSGEEATYYGFIALMCGLPFYVWMKSQHNRGNADD